MILSILRSVPEIHRNKKRVNKESTLVGESQGPCGKAKLTEALNRHGSGRSLVFADDGVLLSNVDMQCVQH